ncbi:hypothetical protein [Actinomadura terrae]|uniref:hypothetical protein n=1 Tax=Actinomadura terrae TaxID=604353 RepID=UPI001FA77B9E|nr:hypothetical protein [Actinomadura terrae]
MADFVGLSAKEVLRYFGNGTAKMIRYELAGTASTGATARPCPDRIPWRPG